MESTTYNGNGNGADRDKAMETIAKCLRLAADPGATEGERDNANRMAEKVMAKWQVSTLEMRLKSAPKDKPRSTAEVKDEFEGVFDPNADWEFHLASDIAKTFNSQIVITGGRTSIHFFGSKNDLEIVNYFFSKLRLEIDSWAEEAYPRGIRGRRAYANGMVSRVRQRLDELYKAVEKEMPNDCRDLVLIDKALVKQRRDEIYPTLVRMHCRTIGSHSAFAHGFSDGGNLNLSSNRAQVR